MMDDPNTFHKGAWAIPDKRGLGVAHRIAVLHGKHPAPLPGGPVPLLAMARMDTRNWDSSCGQIIRSSVTHSVATPFLDLIPHCTKCHAIMGTEAAA